MFSLSGKRALVTGGSGAIGSAIAKKFIELGATVSISGTNDIALSEIANTIGAIKLLCDLSDKEALSTLAQSAIDSMGGIDILVNNAGLNKDTLFIKMSDEYLSNVMSVNFEAAFTLTRQVIKYMSAQRSGRIISISSVVAFTGNVGQANYCASKAALVGFSRSIALEYAKRGITINCVAPGAIQSKMIEKLSEENLEKFVSKIPAGYVGTPEDVAAACCFLASDEARYITGQTLHVNGGMYCG